MPSALFLSPHLDDVVFSCGGLAARLSDAGWETVLVTAFTRSVVPAVGFALACQLDKGLSADVDYMALRRAEDLIAAQLLGFDEVLWLDLLEAPHRGYDSAAALFGPVRDGDDPGLAATLQHLYARYTPDVILAPQCLGGHVDHHVLLAAVLQASPMERMLFYRDTPYAIRNADARPADALAGLPQTWVAISPVLNRKLVASQAYPTQIAFQFETPGKLATTLADFASREGGGRPAESFLGHARLPFKWPGHALRQP